MSTEMHKRHLKVTMHNKLLKLLKLNSSCNHVATQPVITCSKLTTETPEQDVQHVQS